MKYSWPITDTMKAQFALRPASLSEPERSAASLSWRGALRQRMATLRLVKMLGTTLGIAAFFPAYFWVMAQAAPRAVVMPLTRVDDWFAIHEAALPLYASLWLLISLPAAFAKDRTDLLRYAAGAAAMSAVGFAFFWIAPTSVPAFAVDWARYPALGFLKSTDAAGNAFPSLHVSFAVFASAVLSGQLREVGAPSWVRGINRLWCLGIVYATLATRQHVLLDVLGGWVLGLAIYLAAKRTSAATQARGARSP